MLDIYFKEILDNFEKEKTKPFKNNDLVNKIRNDLPKEIIKFLNDNFTVKGACGVNSWPNTPWITIIHNSFDSSQEALILQYNFDTEKSILSLSVILRLKDMNEYVSLKSFLTDSLNDTNLNNFCIDKNNTSNKIISKNYSYNQINDIELKSDLDFIIPVYMKLSSLLNSSIKDESTKSQTSTSNKEIRDIHINYIKEMNYPNDIINPKEFFTDKNIEKIIKCNVSVTDYKEILFKIINNSKSNLNNIINEYDLNFNKLKTRDKVLIYAKSFTDTEYKSVGRLLGSYSFNMIRIDDRLPSPLIITSIIHELSHFLLEKILKELLMKIISSNDTPLISAYVKILLEGNDLNYLLDEYCAHSVEGRFALYGFQDYSSFNYKLGQIADLYSKEDIEYTLILANTFAYDIKNIMEDFIDDDLREDIKDEFLKLKEQPQYEQLELEIESRLDGDYFVEAIGILLTSGISESLNNPQKLERYMSKYQI